MVVVVLMTAVATAALAALASASTALTAAQDEWTPQLPASPEATAAAAMGSDDTAPHGLTVAHWQRSGLLAAVRRGDRPGAPARPARAARQLTRPSWSPSLTSLATASPFLPTRHVRLARPPGPLAQRGPGPPLPLEPAAHLRPTRRRRPAPVPTLSGRAVGGLGRHGSGRRRAGSGGDG